MDWGIWSPSRSHAKAFCLSLVAFRATDNVFLRYDARENSWTTIKAMTGAIRLLSAEAIDGKVYVTGLDRKLSDGEHNPVEVFDPERETWKHVPNYPKRTHSEFHGAAVFDGKLLLTYVDESMVGRIYDPKAEKWENMAGGLTTMAQLLKYTDICSFSRQRTGPGLGFMTQKTIDGMLMLYPEM